MSELRVGAAVEGTDGELGHLDAVVIDPTTNAITHLVITHERLGPRMLVPETKVVKATPDTIEVSLDEAGLRECETFDAPNYNSPEEARSYGEIMLDPGSYFLEPFATPFDGFVLASHERVPKGEITIRRGSAVVTSDGTEIGRVDEFLVDPEDGHITHVVVREGHISKKDIVVPVTAATAIEDDQVVLGLDLTQVEALEKIPVKRHGHVSQAGG